MKFEVAMTTFNRSDILEQSLLSLSKTITDEISNLYISDDCSSNQKVKVIVTNFIEKVKDKFLVDFQVNTRNIGCDLNMCKIINRAFDVSKNPFVITIDSDVIYNKNWLNFMKMAYQEMLNNEKIAAISAYDSRVHPVVGKYNDKLNIKSSIGGLCAMLRKDVFVSIKNQMSWDWEFVKICTKNSYSMLCSNTSFIQHIGKVGTHSTDGVMYDFSDTFIGE